MFWLLDLRLIKFFGFYLALIFVISTALRIRQYRALLALAGGLPSRWPRLLQLMKEHSTILLTWGTVLPLLLMLAVLLLNTLASWLLWPDATEFTLADLLALWPAVPLVLLLGAAMVAFDLYGMCQVGTIDRREMERYFDQAEYWLKSWTAPVVRVFTLGYINPRQMVALEVRSALVNASRLLNYSLWWIVIQTGLRIAFGLALWGSFALEPWLRGLLSGA
jgi:hypothetical protein